MIKFDNDKGEIIIDNKVFKITERGLDPRWDVELNELLSLRFSIKDFPDNFMIQTYSIDGFGSYLFYDLYFLKESDKISFSFVCNKPNKYRECKWGLSTLLTTIAELVNNDPVFRLAPGSLVIDDYDKRIEIYFEIDYDFEFKEIIKKYSNLLLNLIKRAELMLSGMVWRKEYENNESLFCTDLIFPLLRKMDFIDVRYNHGRREFGKDFTFSELSKFGNLRHFAIQVKAGNVSGKVNSEIDEILGQLNDAFSIPYYEVCANETRYISIFIIAISGHFTENSKDKIINKIPSHLKGCVYFLDRDKIIELIERYWK